MTTVQPARAYDEVVSFFASGPSRQQISSFRLSEESLARLRHLLLKSSAGALTDDEAGELDTCVQLDRLLLLIRSRALEEPASLGA
jgi:hypothetical protein